MNKPGHLLIAALLLTGFVNSYGAELPDTGQVLSSTTTFGEDTDYQPVPSQPSYTDNGDGTIIDRRTWLMWVKDGNSAGSMNGNSPTWIAALNFCEGLTYAGYSDWRLPNRNELISIVDYGKRNPAINTVYFTNTKNLWYWTSTTEASDPTDAWIVMFSDGHASCPLKGSNSFVRCVRGGP